MDALSHVLSFAHVLKPPMICRDNRTPCTIRTTTSARKVGLIFVMFCHQVLNFCLSARRSSQANSTASALHTCGLRMRVPLLTPPNSSSCLLTALQAMRRPSKHLPSFLTLLQGTNFAESCGQLPESPKRSAGFSCCRVSTAIVTGIGTLSSRNAACPVVSVSSPRSRALLTRY